MTTNQPSKRRDNGVPVAKRSRKESWSLRGWGIAVAAISSGGALLTGALAGWYSWHEQKARLDQSMVATTRAIIQATDSEFDQAVALELALATAPSLDRGDTNLFGRQARPVVKPFGYSLVLCDPGASKEFNTQTPIVRPMFRSPEDGTWTTAVQILTSDGQGKSYVIMLSVPRERFQRIIDELQLPPEWLPVVIDQQWKIVALPLNRKQFIGAKAANPHLMTLLSPNSTYDGRELEGYKTVNARSRSAKYGWTAAVAVLQSLLLRQFLGPAALAALTGFLMCLVALGTVGLLASRLIRDVRVLSKAAEQLSERQVVPAGAMHITELKGVANEIQHASERLKAEEEFRKRAEFALRESEERQTFLLKVVDALRPLTDAAQMEEATCRLLGDHLRVDRAYYVHIDEGAGIATVSRQYLREGAQSSIGVHPLEAFGWSLPPMRRGEMIVLDDIHQSELVPAADVAAMEAVQQAAVVAAPIIRGDALVAVLCVTDRVPRKWKPEQVELVREVMERTWAAIERVRAEAAIRESEGELRAAVEERNALLKEVHHRVKNNLQVISSLLEMQARTTSDGQELSSLSEAHNRINAIAAIHELLYQSGSFSEVDLAAYARRIVRHVVSLYDERSRIETSVEGDGITVDLARAVPLGLLLNELVSNACKHAFPPPAGGALSVRLQTEDGHLRLQVKDDGVGLPAGLTERPPSTLGLQLVRMLAKQLRATVSFDSSRGTSVEIRMPLERFFA